MSEVTTNSIRHPNLSVVPPSCDSTIIPPIYALKELDDDFFIEFILANKDPDNTKSPNQVGANFNGNLLNSDCMMTQTLDGSHAIGDFDLFGPQPNFTQPFNGEKEDDSLTGSNGSKKKGRPLSSKNKKKNGEVSAPLTRPSLQSSS